MIDSIIQRVDSMMIDLQENIVETYNEEHIPKFDLTLLE